MAMDIWNDLTEEQKKTVCGGDVLRVNYNRKRTATEHLAAATAEVDRVTALSPEDAKAELLAQAQASEVNRQHTLDRMNERWTSCCEPYEAEVQAIVDALAGGDGEAWEVKRDLAGRAVGLVVGSQG